MSFSQGSFIIPQLRRLSTPFFEKNNIGCKFIPAGGSPARRNRTVPSRLSIVFGADFKIRLRMSAHGTYLRGLLPPPQYACKTTSWRAPFRCPRSAKTGSRSAQSRPFWPWTQNTYTCFWPATPPQMPPADFSPSVCLHADWPYDASSVSVMWDYSSDKALVVPPKGSGAPTASPLSIDTTRETGFHVLFFLNLSPTPPRIRKTKNSLDKARKASYTVLRIQTRGADAKSAETESDAISYPLTCYG